MAAPKPGGFKLSLAGLKNKPGLKNVRLENDTKRQRLGFDDEEREDPTKHQEISGWDTAEGGAVDIGGKKEKEGPRVIPSQPNRDWKAEARRIQLSKAPHTQVQNANVEEKVEEQKLQFGLTILQKDESNDNETVESTVPEAMEVEEDNVTEEQRLEKKALHALLHGRSANDELVIPVQTEEEALQYDLQNAPDAPTLAAYEATPIEGFGAALLRGMGWKDGETIKKGGVAPEAVAIKRRPALLGIGAKADAAAGIELGAWSGKDRSKKGMDTYNPLTMRNKKTGEVISEEELKLKLSKHDLVNDKPEKERRNERRRDKERRSDRRGDRDDYHDSDCRRDKRKDKERDNEYDSERRRTSRREDGHDSERRRDKRRERSRSPDDRKEKRHDRYRSRSRDSRRDRDRRDRSRDSDDRRKRRREKEYDHDDDRDDRKRRHKDEKYRK
ncbi:hypothetical protein IQ07DRAFT_561890 [Pyrenochaeta sp. DS3sAY3a]|nr:hypothetical protein IQ07DRAFT_561890 [Pyrenochaeta sp. DS3sAY3a]